MTIKRLQNEYERLGTQIEACQAELADLKARRKEVKARLGRAKKSAKNGEALPESEAEGLTEKIASQITEKVITPLAGILGVGPTQGK